MRKVLVYLTCEEVEDYVEKNENIEDNETLAVSNVEFCRDDRTINIELFVVPDDDVKCQEKKRMKIGLNEIISKEED